MKKIKIEKLTLNVGAGTNQELLKKAIRLLKTLSGREPVKTVTQKRIPSWGVRPGLPIGCKITIRGEQANELLKKLLAAKENKLRESHFDTKGNISFGIHEYIDVPGLEYDSSIGIIGFQVSITLSRAGFRVGKRKIRRTKIGKTHALNQKESMDFFKKEYNIVVEESK